jgi:hypothetical protein
MTTAEKVFAIRDCVTILKPVVLRIPRWRGIKVVAVLMKTAFFIQVTGWYFFIHLRHCLIPASAEDIAVAAQSFCGSE